MSQEAFQKFCAWSGTICVVLFFGAFAFAGFIPPLSPSLSPEQVAAHYQEHAAGIRGGMVLMLISGMFYAAFTAVTSGQMKRIPGITPTVIYVQLVSGAFACLTFLVPAMLFEVTAFRPERDPQLTYILNDMSWIVLVMPWPPFMMQNFSFAYAVLCYPRSAPLFPRWLGYMNIWAPITFTPAVLLPFFKSGPFAWSGILVIWIPASVFIVWFVVMSMKLSTAVDRPS